MEAEKLHLKLNLLTFGCLLSYVVSVNFTLPFHASLFLLMIMKCRKSHLTGVVNLLREKFVHILWSLFPSIPDTIEWAILLLLTNIFSPQSPSIWGSSAKAGCSKCENKVDTGYEYLCCSDCSDPYTEYGDNKLGYCESGAEIIAETKPKELFKWVTGPWKPCSSTCDGGIRYRDVDCYVVFADTLLPDYPVYDHKCSIEDMPAREEPCNASCIRVMQRWILTTLMTLAILVIGLASYALYRRRTSMQYGQVYITMEAYP